MRESIGATYIFSICLTFIILFTAYLAISVNYAKAFRIKSDIVSMIEEHEGYSNNMDADISTYLLSQAYTSYGDCEDRIGTSGFSQGEWQLVGTINNMAPAGKNNICIYRLGVNIEDSQKDDTPRAYYRVKAFFKFDLPMIGAFTTFPVSGETKLIRDFNH